MSDTTQLVALLRQLPGCPPVDEAVRQAVTEQLVMQCASLSSLPWSLVEPIFSCLFSASGLSDITAFVQQRETDRQLERQHPTPASLAAARDREGLYRQLLTELIHSHVGALGYTRRWNPITPNVLLKEPQLCIEIITFLTKKVLRITDKDTEEEYSTQNKKEERQSNSAKKQSKLATANSSNNSRSKIPSAIGVTAAEKKRISVSPSPASSSAPPASVPASRSSVSGTVLRNRAEEDNPAQVRASLPSVDEKKRQTEADRLKKAQQDEAATSLLRSRRDSNSVKGKSALSHSSSLGVPASQRSKHDSGSDDQQGDERFTDDSSNSVHSPQQQQQEQPASKISYSKHKPQHQPHTLATEPPRAPRSPVSPLPSRSTHKHKPPGSTTAATSLDVTQLTQQLEQERQRSQSLQQQLTTLQSTLTRSAGASASASAQQEQVVVDPNALMLLTAQHSQYKRQVNLMNGMIQDKRGLMQDIFNLVWMMRDAMKQMTSSTDGDAEAAVAEESMERRLKKMKKVVQRMSISLQETISKTEDAMKRLTALDAHTNTLQSNMSSNTTSMTSSVDDNTTAIAALSAIPRELHSSLSSFAAQLLTAHTQFVYLEQAARVTDIRWDSISSTTTPQTHSVSELAEQMKRLAADSRKLSHTLLSLVLSDPSLSSSSSSVPSSSSSSSSHSSFASVIQYIQHQSFTSTQRQQLLHTLQALEYSWQQREKLYQSDLQFYQHTHTHMYDWIQQHIQAVRGLLQASHSALSVWSSTTPTSSALVSALEVYEDGDRSSEALTRLLSCISNSLPSLIQAAKKHTQQHNKIQQLEQQMEQQIQEFKEHMNMSVKQAVHEAQHTSTGNAVDYHPRLPLSNTIHRPTTAGSATGRSNKAGGRSGRVHHPQEWQD